MDEDESDQPSGSENDDHSGAALVRQIQAELPHGTRAFRELVTAYTPIVYGRALRLVGSSHDAEEVAQDVFLRVFRSIGRYRFERPLVHWLHTITTNAARNHLRGRYREERKRGELFDSTARDRASMREAPLPTPFVGEALVEAMDALDATTRVAVVLRYVEGQSFPEIARELGMGESAVKMRVRRGVKKLREGLGGFSDSS